jgi:hypothetical protein
MAFCCFWSPRSESSAKSRIMQIDTKNSIRQFKVSAHSNLCFHLSPLRRSKAGKLLFLYRESRRIKCLTFGTAVALICLGWLMDENINSRERKNHSLEINLHRVFSPLIFPSWATLKDTRKVNPRSAIPKRGLFGSFGRTKGTFKISLDDCADRTPLTKGAHNAEIISCYQAARSISSDHAERPERTLFK